MTVILWIGTALLGLLILLLVTPIHLQLRWNEHQRLLSLGFLTVAIELDYRLRCNRVRLLSWTVSTRTWQTDKTATRTGSGSESPRPAPVKHSAKSQGVGGFLSMALHLWTARATIRRATLILIRLTARVIRSWHLARADVRITAGLGDPAQTGLATGCFYSILPIVRNRFPGLQIAWQPRFDRAVWDVEAHVVMRALPGRLVYHILTAAASWPWREMRRLKANLAG